LTGIALHRKVLGDMHPTKGPDVEYREAEDIVAEVGRLRSATRSQLSALWWPLFVFGILSLLSAAVIAGPGTDALGVYWTVAGPLGGIAVGLYYRDRERALGVESPSLPYILTGLGIFVGAMAAGVAGDAFGSELAAAAGPSLVVSAGYVVFALLERSLLLGAVAVALGLEATWLWVAGGDPELIPLILAATYGTAFVATGFVLWIQGRGG
jgi:hypothetical protein